MTSETEKFCVIITTAGSLEEAHKIATRLVSEKLAACVQRIQIHSCYTWNEQVQEDAEYLLLIKTTSELFEKVRDAIQSVHSYEVPEIVQLPIEQGSDSYLKWILANTRGEDEE